MGRENGGYQKHPSWKGGLSSLVLDWLVITVRWDFDLGEPEGLICYLLTGLVRPIGPVASCVTCNVFFFKSLRISFLKTISEYKDSCLSYKVTQCIVSYCV